MSISMIYGMKYYKHGLLYIGDYSQFVKHDSTAKDVLASAQHFLLGKIMFSFNDTDYVRW